MSIYTRVPRAEFKEIRALAAVRKAKREQRASDNALLSSKTGLGFPPRPAKRRRKPSSSRKQAFARLKASCTLFVLLRTKHRTAGMCEVGIICGGEYFATLAYHIQPAATGNAVKYDTRNLVGACRSCNGGEYFDRKRGTYDRWEARHKELQGPEVYAAVKSLAGRKQISPAEANEMNDCLRLRIERGDFSL